MDDCRVAWRPGLILLFANPAFDRKQYIKERVTGHFKHQHPDAEERKDIQNFTNWAAQRPLLEELRSETPSKAITYFGVQWTTSLLRGKYRVCKAHVPEGTFLPKEPRLPEMPKNTLDLPRFNDPKTSLPRSGSTTPIQHPSKLNIGTDFAKSPDGTESPILEPIERDEFGYFSPQELVALKLSRENPSSPIYNSGIQYPGQKSRYSSSRDRSRSNSNSKSPRMQDMFDRPPKSVEEAIQRTKLMSKMSAPSYDWTAMSDVSHLPKHIQWIKGISWSKTSLGPMEFWEPELRQVVNLIMSIPFPAAMYWGNDLIQIYNEAYIALCGPKHPSIMGKAYREGWPEIWEFIEEPINSAMNEGRSTSKFQDFLSITRHGGKSEECYFDWALTPLLGSDGSIKGLYNPAMEQTRRVVSERRITTVQEVSKHTSALKSMVMFWQRLLETLGTNKHDTPFAVGYSVKEETDSDSPQSSISSGIAGLKQCNLEGSYSVPEGHQLLKQTIDFQHGNDCLACLLRKALNSESPTHYSVEEKTLEVDFLNGIQDYWKTPCEALVICPIFLTNAKQLAGFLVIGVNSQRPYDEDYRSYVSLLSRQAATSMASIVLFEEEVAKAERAAKAAAKQQVALSEQLKVTAEQAHENEAKFTLLTSLNPGGLFIADAEGIITYCNEPFRKTMCVSEFDIKDRNWMYNMVYEDRMLFKERWEALLEDGEKLDLEVCLDAPGPWLVGGTRIEKWALFGALADIDADGHVKSILGCVTDITTQKQAEIHEKRLTDKAVKHKQDQEAFIDMTSHEMRNPLSSILQCADEIYNLAAEQLESSTLEPSQRMVMEQFSQVSKTLGVCSQHEKRIVDDVLTLSKMEAGKLKVSPESADPKELINKAKTMFAYDIKYHGIDLVMNVDPSYEKLGIPYVNMDPSRVLAVLVNLTTNSIKFTSREKTKKITITLSASLNEPYSGDQVNFIKRKERAVSTETAEWGSGAAVYLHYSVSDTGKGMSEKELSNLFGRFSQASDKTHVTYGGSGLGLYIARLLSEIHGGRIGVASTPGKGSTFAFYIKGKRTKTLPPSQSKKDLVKVEGEVSVLLVEDNDLVAATASRSLRKSGYVVYTAEHGVECLGFLKKTNLWKHPSVETKDTIKLDVVLMDQQMPEMDGLTCTREIRKLEKTGELKCHVPIIGTTANARAEQLELVLEAGMVGALRQ